MNVANSEDIVVVRPVRDSNGDLVSYTEHTLRSCIVAPTSSSEEVRDGDTVTTRYDVYVLNGADVVATDRLRRQGDTTAAQGASLKSRAPWLVVGDPAVWRSPFSEWSPGKVVTIERVTG